MSVNAHVNCARVLLIIRVRMASKRPKVDFSPEAILREIREEKELSISINSVKSKLSVKRISELVRRKENDLDAASLLALMFGFDTVSWVMAA